MLSTGFLSHSTKLSKIYCSCATTYFIYKPEYEHIFYIIYELLLQWRLSIKINAVQAQQRKHYLLTVHVQFYQRMCNRNGVNKQKSNYTDSQKTYLIEETPIKLSNNTSLSIFYTHHSAIVIFHMLSDIYGLFTRLLGYYCDTRRAMFLEY